MTPIFSRNGRLALALVLLGGLALLGAILWIGRGPGHPPQPAAASEPAAEPTASEPTLAPSPAPALAHPTPAAQPQAAPAPAASALPAFGPEPGSQIGDRIRAKRALRPVVGWVGQRPDGGR